MLRRPSIQFPRHRQLVWCIASVANWHCSDQWRSDRGAGGAGRIGRHLLGAAKGRKTPKIKKNHVKIQIVSFISKPYGQRVPIVSYYVGSLAAKGRPKRAANLTTALGGQRSCYATGSDRVDRAGINRRHSLELHPRVYTPHSALSRRARCANRSFVFAGVCILTASAAAAGLRHASTVPSYIAAGRAGGHFRERRLADKSRRCNAICAPSDGRRADERHKTVLATSS